MFHVLYTVYKHVWDIYCFWTPAPPPCCCCLPLHRPALPGDILVLNCFLSHLALSCIRSRPLSRTGYMLSSGDKQWPSKCSVISKQERGPLLIDVEIHQAARTTSGCRRTMTLRELTTKYNRQHTLGHTFPIYKSVRCPPSMFQAISFHSSLQSNILWPAGGLRLSVAGLWLPAHHHYTEDLR